MSTPTANDAPGGGATAAAPRGRARGQRGAAAARSRAARARERARDRGGPVTLTGRGGVVVVFGTAFVCAVLSRWLDLPLLAGGGFAVGCALAAFATRPADLLTLVVSPPVMFFAATFLAVLVTSLGDGSLLRALTVGVFTALAATAPWLFFATLLVLVIAMARGLPANVRELRDKLAGVRLFEQEENENPVRWDDSPPRRARHRDTD
ncbi:DUF6542 domain-containing protein [Spirillospora albida]|uniref:DUF6542 domain-containing protein n=1 Tax=Spirillospora albida TaxID=58123 RepID=UPI0004C2AC3D|nr:DUF6542 domain-containing protein [Spirillospora albida]